MQPQQKCCSYVNTQVVSHRTTDAAVCCSSWQTAPAAGGRKIVLPNEVLTESSRSICTGSSFISPRRSSTAFLQLEEMATQVHLSRQTGDLTREFQGLNFPALSTRPHLSRKYFNFCFLFSHQIQSQSRQGCFSEPTIYFCSYFYCKTY